MNVVLMIMLFLAVAKILSQSISIKALAYYIGDEFGVDKMPNKEQLKKATDDVIKHTIDDLLKKN